MSIALYGVLPTLQIPASGHTAADLREAVVMEQTLQSDIAQQKTQLLAETSTSVANGDTPTTPE